MTRQLLTFCTGISSKKLVCDINHYHLVLHLVLRQYYTGLLVGVFPILINFKQNICNLQLISVYLIV